MIWRDGTELPTTRIKIIMNQGGLGDMICRLPAIKFMLDNYPHLNLDVYWHNYFLDFARGVIPESPRIQHHSRDNENSISTKRHHVIFDFSPRFATSMAQSLVTHAFITLMDRSPQLNEINYLKAPVFNNKLLDFTLPKNYVVVTTGYTSSTREWKAKYINDFVRNVKKGLELDVVFLGKEVNSLYRNQVNLTGFSTEVDTTHGIDLRDKTDLFQALEIMRGARAVVGLDNGLTHLAAMTDVPIVMGFTTVDPKHRLPVRHNQLGWNVATVTPYLELPCRLCQSRMNFVKWDFRKCFYDDYACLEHITGVRMYEALYKVLNKELK